MCLPDVLLGAQRWFVRLRGGGEKTAGHGAQRQCKSVTETTLASPSR